VFNADQVESDQQQAKEDQPYSDRIEEAERFSNATKAEVRHCGDRACYVPSVDQIWLPRFEQFRDALSHYSVLDHETVHWCGAKHRLNRDLSGRFGTDAYAVEGLIAELGSAFIAAHLKISVEPRPDHAAYVSSWLHVLRGDPTALLTAAVKAQQAMDYIIGLAQPAMVGCSLDPTDDTHEALAA
jgi:antirestriction protein ArdC